jgi:prefoldin alpha subunit
MVNKSVSEKASRPSLTREDVETLLYTYQMLQEQLNSLEQQRNMVSQQIQMFNISKSTISGLKNKDVGHEIIVPIGTVYIKSKLAESDKVLVNLGAGYTVEKTIDGAIEYLDTAINNMSEVKKKIEEEMEESESRLVQIKPTVDAIYRSMGKSLDAQMQTSGKKQ